MKDLSAQAGAVLPGAQSEQLLRRLRAVTEDIRQHGVILHKGRRCLTGYSYGEFYDWDLYFENIFMSYYGISDYCRNGVEMFLDTQHESGFVARTMGIAYQKPRHQFKPFLAQIALLGSSQTGDFRWLEGKYYRRLQKYLDYWFWFCDFDKNGLCVWDGSDHSGMDNQKLRLGFDGVMEVEGVDLNCYLYRELQAMAAIAQTLGREADAAQYRGHARRLADKINDTLWNDTDAFYYDRNERTGAPVKIKSIAGFIPLWAGIASAERAGRLIERHLLNPEEFWLQWPVATWAKNEAGYYQQRQGDECNWMGTTWVPTNYMVFHGLMRYGYTEKAKELADKTFTMAMLESNTREYYNAENGCGQGLNPFWGWSALAYFMPLEHSLGYDPTDLTQRKIKSLACENLNTDF